MARRGTIGSTSANLNTPGSRLVRAPLSLPPEATSAIKASASAATQTLISVPHQPPASIAYARIGRVALPGYRAPEVSQAPEGHDSGGGENRARQEQGELEAPEK